MAAKSKATHRLWLATLVLSAVALWSLTMGGPCVERNTSVERGGLGAAEGEAGLHPPLPVPATRKGARRVTPRGVASRDTTGEHSSEAPIQAASTLPIDLAELSLLEVSKLADADLARISKPVLENGVIVRGSFLPALRIIHMPPAEPGEEFSGMLRRVVDPDDVAPELLASARQELARLKRKLELIWDDEQRDPSYVAHATREMSETEYKRFLASQCGYYGRIALRAEPLLAESERIVLGILQVPDSSATLFGGP